MTKAEAQALGAHQRRTPAAWMKSKSSRRPAANPNSKRRSLPGSFLPSAGGSLLTSGEVRRLRVGIRQLNDAHGTPNTDTSGYHETMTRAYICLIARALSAQPGNVALAQCAQALVAASPLAAKDVLLVYYSKELLMSLAARRGWREPDQNALDLLEPGAHAAPPTSGEDRPSES